MACPPRSRLPCNSPTTGVLYSVLQLEQRVRGGAGPASPGHTVSLGRPRSGLQSPQHSTDQCAHLKMAKERSPRQAFTPSRCLNSNRTNLFTPKPARLRLNQGHLTPANADTELARGSLRAGDTGTGWEGTGAGGRKRHRRPRVGGSPARTSRGSLEPPNIPLACRAGSEQSQAQGRKLEWLLYISGYLQMAEMFCLSRQPLGQTFVAQAKGDNLSPQSRPPQAPDTR